jgi:poly(hydroxyalkanoate) granule-associated protein
VVKWTKENIMNRTQTFPRKMNLEKIAQAAIARVDAAREAALERIEEARSRGAKAATRFEKVFEQRVSQAMSRLGMPTQREVRALARDVATLKTTVAKLRRTRPSARARA